MRSGSGSQASNSDLLSCIPAASVRVDAFGYVKALNAAAMQLVCELREGQPLMSRLDAKAAQQLATILADSEATDVDVCEFEGNIDRRRFRLAVSGSAFDDGSRIVQLKDITYYRAMSDQISEREQRFRSLFSQNPDAVFSLSNEGYFLEANECMEELTGCRDASLAHTQWEEVVAKEDRAIVAKSFQKALKGTPSYYRCSIISRSGNKSIVQVNHIPIMIHGRVVGVFGIARDRTEHYRVAESRRMLRAAIAQIQDVIIITETNPLDEPGPRIVFVNEPVKEMTGYSAEELIGRSPRILQGAETDPATLQRIRAALEEKRPIKEVVLNYCKDGQPYWNEIEIVPIVAKDVGQREYFASVQRDITEAKRQEMELRHSQEELRRLNSAQDTIIEQERRRIARDLHDELGQTLTAMKLDLSIAIRDLSSIPESKLKRLKAFDDYIDDVIDRVREIASNLRPAMLDDLGFEAAAEWFLKQRSGRDGLVTHWEADLDGSNQAKGDVATALFRILQECITNVIRHAEARAVRVHYRESKQLAALKVRDDGVGFNPSVIKVSGLGLVGMRERVAMLGGTLSIHSQPGDGTEIIVTLPLGKES